LQAEFAEEASELEADSYSVPWAVEDVRIAAVRQVDPNADRSAAAA